MIVKFNKTLFATSLMLLTTEICIAAFLTEGFIRHTFGDFLAVILLYCSFRAFFETNQIYLAIGVLVFAFVIEFAQLYNLLDYLQLRHHKLASIILGSTFHVSDLIAYTFGTVSILFIDLKTTA